MRNDIPLVCELLKKYKDFPPSEHMLHAWLTDNPKGWRVVTGTDGSMIGKQTIK